MARPLRLEFPGAIFHVFTRGNRKDDIFLDDEDRIRFLRILSSVVKRLNWICHAYCLMDNHYHLLIEIPDGIMARGMKYLNSVYAQYFNRKHDLVGHLLQGRYKSRLVKGNVHFLTQARYINRNPVDAGLVEDPADWPWSSYRATIGSHPKPEFLTVNFVLDCLSKNVDMARKLFEAFVEVEPDQEEDWLFSFFQSGPYQDNYAKILKPSLDVKQSFTPVQIKQKILCRPSLAEIFSGVDKNDRPHRNNLIRDAFKYYGYTQAELAFFLGLNRSTIGKIIRKTKLL